MLAGRRFRVRFTPDQLAYADEVAGVCRAVWNTGLDQRREYRQRRVGGGFQGPVVHQNGQVPVAVHAVAGEGGRPDGAAQVAGLAEAHLPELR